MTFLHAFNFYRVEIEIGFSETKHPENKSPKINECLLKFSVFFSQKNCHNIIFASRNRCCILTILTNVTPCYHLAE